VILDVHSHVTEVRDQANKEQTAVSSHSSGEVAQFAVGLRGTRMEEHHLASTLLVPLRTIVLVGGMSGSSDDVEQLYLFVEVAVQEPRPAAPIHAPPSGESAPAPPR